MIQCYSPSHRNLNLLI